MKLLLPLAVLAATATSSWVLHEDAPVPHPRHEAACVAVGEKLYLLGGRRIQPVNRLDPATGKWEILSKPPIELHHFQPLVRGTEIWVLGAMTGPFPNEKPVPEIHIYDTATDTWKTGATIPEDRRRGGAGVAEHDGKIYLSCGIQRGHMGGWVKWLDRFDPATGEWEQLPDAPHARDHFQAVVHDGKIVNSGGRRTSKETNQLMNLTVPEIDVFDIASGKWSTLDNPLPTPRAGTSSFVLDGKLLVAGGESATQPKAHGEVQALDLATGEWSDMPSLNQGRHGSGLALIGGKLYTASGSGRRGGQPELTTYETLDLP